MEKDVRIGQRCGGGMKLTQEGRQYCRPHWHLPETYTVTALCGLPVTESEQKPVCVRCCVRGVCV